VRLGTMAIRTLWTRIADGIGRRSLIAGTVAASAGVMLALGCGYHHAYYSPPVTHVYHGGGYGYGAPPVVVHHYGGGGYGYGSSPVVHVHHYGGFTNRRVVVHHYH